MLVAIHESFGEGLDNGRAARAGGANKGNAGASGIGEVADDALHDFLVGGELKAGFVAPDMAGKIDGKAFEGGGEAKGEVAGDTTGVKRFLGIRDDGREIFVPSDALIEVGEAEAEFV